MQNQFYKLLWLFWVLLLPVLGFGQELMHWRIWNDPGKPFSTKVGWCGYSQSGRLYVTSFFEGNYVCTWMDGYSNHVFDEDPDLARIAKESIDGVVWTLDFYYLSGHVRGFSRFEFENENQIRKIASYEIEELKTVSLPDDFPPWDVPFLPYSQNKVLFLLNDCLIEFDADANETRILKRVNETNLLQFIHMTEGREGAVWISGENGLAQLTEMENRTIPRDSAKNNSAFHWEEFTFPPDSPYSDLAFPIEAKNGEIWGAAFSEQIGKRILLGFDGENWTPLFQDENNGVLIGWPGKKKDFWLLKDAALDFPFSFFKMRYVRNYTLSHVVCRQEKIVSRKEDLSGYVGGMTLEPNGPFWLAVRGLARYAPPIWETPNEVKHLEKSVYAIYEDKQRRLFFVYEDRIVVLEDEDWREYLLPDNKLTAKHTQQSIALCPDGRIALITTDRDLLFMTLGNLKADFSVYPNPKNREWEIILNTDKGKIWILSSDQETKHRRLESYDGENFTTVINNIQNKYIGRNPHHILEAPDGDIWMSASNGISHWSNGEFQNQGRYDLTKELSGVFCIVLTPDGALWAGEHNKLLKFSGSDWDVIKTGLANVHNMITPSEGAVWIASQTGIHRYKDGSWLPNTHEDGLAASRTYKLLEDSRGRIWAGTASGLSLYDKTADPDPPQTYLDSQKNVANFLLDENINIIYSGMDKWNYTPPGRLLYSYRVDESAWSLFSSDVIAAVTGLPAGGHVFEVCAMDRNGNVDETPARFSFSVSVPWHRDFAFQMILSLSVLMILFLIGLHVYHHFNVEKLASIRTAQLRSAEHHLLDISERERQRIGRDLHDDVVQDLTAIAMSGELLAKELDGLSPESAGDLRDLIKVIDRASLRTRKLSQGLAPVHLESLGLIPALRELALSVKKQFNIDCQLISESTVQNLSKESQLNLYRIVQESLQNAVKHADPQRIGIEIIQEDSMLEIRIEDDGKGFDVEQNAKTGMGISIMRYRANLLGGSLVVSSRLGEGTRIVCRIPIS